MPTESVPQKRRKIPLKDQLTKRTAMWLLWILSLAAAASFLLPATGEVVDSFTKCKKFFLNGTPPKLRPRNSARICQLYKNSYRFATMYDKDQRIPTFSAYIYQPGKGQRWEEWKIEPQLALPKDREYYRHKSMELEETCGIDHQRLANSQAVEEDYYNADPYDRGHLAPILHQPDEDSKDATCTLTNIVPQFHDLNIGEWKRYEEHINAAGCHVLYILVGAVPGNTNLKNRVNIPSHIWAAGCCVMEKHRRKSWAVIALNNESRVDRPTLENMQMQLAGLYKQEKVDLFNGACNTAPGPHNGA
ncbi:hypothetical protein Chor_013154 [Crotalus horridus]